MFSLYNFTLTLIILATLSLLVAYSDIACSGASILFYHLLIRSEVLVFYENKSLSSLLLLHSAAAVIYIYSLGSLRVLQATFYLSTITILAMHV